MSKFAFWYTNDSPRCSASLQLKPVIVKKCNCKNSRTSSQHLIPPGYLWILFASVTDNRVLFYAPFGMTQQTHLGKSKLGLLPPRVSAGKQLNSDC